MAIYKNIDGISKPSFKLGPKGLTLSSEAIISGSEFLSKFFVKDNAGNRKDVVLSGDISIPREVCKSITTQDNGITLIVLEKYNLETRQWEREEVEVNTLYGPKVQTPGHIVTFSDKQNLLADSGYAITTVLDEDSTNKNTSVPTTEAVFKYIGDINEILMDRMGIEEEDLEKNNN